MASVPIAEHVVTVTDMNHGIRSDSVHFAIGPPVSVYGAGEVRLLVQNVVPLQHDGEGLATQETVRNLGVPKQFVGVECRVTVTSLTVHMDVGGKVGTPWEGDSGVGTILVVPRGEIVGGLQTVVRVCIGGVVVG